MIYKEEHSLILATFEVQAGRFSDHPVTRALSLSLSTQNNKINKVKQSLKKSLKNKITKKNPTKSFFHGLAQGTISH